MEYEKVLQEIEDYGRTASYSQSGNPLLLDVSNGGGDAFKSTSATSRLAQQCPTLTSGTSTSVAARATHVATISAPISVASMIRDEILADHVPCLSAQSPDPLQTASNSTSKSSKVTSSGTITGSSSNNVFFPGLTTAGKTDSESDFGMQWDAIMRKGKYGVLGRTGRPDRQRMLDIDTRPQHLDPSKVEALTFSDEELINGGLGDGGTNIEAGVVDIAASGSGHIAGTQRNPKTTADEVVSDMSKGQSAGVKLTVKKTESEPDSKVQKAEDMASPSAPSVGPSLSSPVDWTSQAFSWKDSPGTKTAASEAGPKGEIFPTAASAAPPRIKIVHAQKSAVESKSSRGLDSGHAADLNTSYYISEMPNSAWRNQDILAGREEVSFLSSRGATSAYYTNDLMPNSARRNRDILAGREEVSFLSPRGPASADFHRNKNNNDETNTSRKDDFEPIRSPSEYTAEDLARVPKSYIMAYEPPQDIVGEIERTLHGDLERKRDSVEAERKEAKEGRGGGFLKSNSLLK